MDDFAFDAITADGLAVVAKFAALANAKCIAGVICIVADVVGIMEVAEIVFVVWVVDAMGLIMALFEYVTGDIA